nr:uncharacterized protein LOC132432972 [Delphinus delphis]
MPNHALETTIYFLSMNQTLGASPGAHRGPAGAQGGAQSASRRPPVVHSSRAPGGSLTPACRGRGASENPRPACSWKPSGTPLQPGALNDCLAIRKQQQQRKQNLRSGEKRPSAHPTAQASGPPGASSVGPLGALRPWGPGAEPPSPVRGFCLSPATSRLGLLQGLEPSDQGARRLPQAARAPVGLGRERPPSRCGAAASAGLRRRGRAAEGRSLRPERRAGGRARGSRRIARAARALHRRQETPPLPSPVPLCMSPGVSAASSPGGENECRAGFPGNDYIKVLC